MEGHGYVTFIAWPIFGFLLVATSRYWKRNWQVMHVAHNVIGTAVTLITIISSLQMYAKYDWEQLTSIHGILGLLGMIITFLVGVSGVVTIWVMFRAADERWEKHERITAIARIHRITGYVMLVFGNIIVSGGITTYLVSLGFGGKSAIGFICITTWILCLVIMEYNYRRRFDNSYHFDKLPLTYEPSLAKYTPEKLEFEVEIGTPLVVFDQFILNVGWFEKIHPGGRFTLSKNYGRDISKFYYGGYVLVNGKGIMAYMHSAPALEVVKSMVVGTMENQQDVREQEYYLTRKSVVASDTYTF